MSQPEAMPEKPQETAAPASTTPDADGSTTNPDPQVDETSGHAGVPEDERVHPQHISKILEEVLITPEPPAVELAKRHRHHMWLDFAIGLGLLVAMGGFSIGLTKFYMVHKAQQCIMHRNYKAAIGILQDAPLPMVFNYSSEPKDLLNEALYLDAMEKLDNNAEDKGALKELEKIQPGSRFFTLSQEVLQDHFHPSAVQLQGKLKNDASTVEQVIPKPIIEPEKE